MLPLAIVAPTGRTGKPKELRERAKLGSAQEIEWMLNVHTLQTVNTTFIRNVHSLQALNMQTGTVTLAAVAQRKRVTNHSDIQIVLGLRGELGLQGLGLSGNGALVLYCFRA